MKLTKKIISLLLAVLMLCGTLTCFSVFSASAEEASTETGTGVEEKKIDYLNQVFASPEEKLATMKLMTTKGNYQIYADENSGEVAVKDLFSGQILFTNPYDIGATNAVESVKQELMSQIVVRYTENGRPKSYYSYEYAASRGQVKVKNIKNGIRVEYTIGREEARRLVPRMIEQSRFEELIKLPLLEYYDGNEENFYFKQFMSYYQLKGLEFCTSDRLKEDLLSVYPVVNDMNIYVFDPTATTVELEKREEDIKTACPNYSYEEMDYDHQLTEFESEDENPPLFKMALEYTLDADGFSVRLPANGIRFNESKFQLDSICVLPYMGAGNIAYEGYTFFPDGSGALFAFEDLVDVTSNSVSSKVYGTDYAYHEISGTYQQTVRYPVFGIVEKTRYYDFNEFSEATGETETTTINGVIYDALVANRTEGTPLPTYLSAYSTMVADSAEAVENIVNRGFVAIIEEGDAMAEISTVHEGVKHPYDSVQMSFYPRPQDTYNMADAISVGTATDWTVVSTRKYVGSYKIRYVMLTDSGIAEENKLETGKWYDATWMGMATAYREYLVKKGVLAPLTDEELSNDIPLYIEAFGTVETVEKIMSIPVEVMKPLTTFSDVQTMYTELLSEGIRNINFKLTGHANGGFFSTMPYNLKWEKSVSKDTTFQALIDYAKSINDGDYSVLLDYAKENNVFETEEEYNAFEDVVEALSEGNLGIFPDFDFSYVNAQELFDGLSLRKHAVRTIDDRYTSKRLYYATRQKHMGFFQLAVSPAYFDHFYEKLIGNYLQYDNVTGISAATLGDALNSDFDEDEPYNREDSKSFVLQALEYFTSSTEKGGANLEVMVNGGNAYTWQYVDHILGAPLDSSRYIRASYSVPFLGVVLHGYSQFAGSPLNMEGDLNYAKLKAIENGAAIYFTLSYQNTQVLKEAFLTSQYYSVRYDIWYDDVVEIYDELNKVTGDLQDKLIVGHEFLSGMRVPDTDELYGDIMADFNTVLDFQSNKSQYEEQLKNDAVADARDNIASTQAQAEAFIELCITKYSGNQGAAYLYYNGERSFERRYATFVEANEALKAIEAEYDAASAEEKTAMQARLESAKVSQKQARAQLLTHIRNISRAIAEMEVAYENLSKLLEDAESGQLLINSTEGIPQSIIVEIEEQLEATRAMMEQKLGISFLMTVGKAEIDTFIHTHVTELVIKAYGDGENTTVDKMENLFKMIQAGDYGLSMDQIDLLRYLDANRDLTDDEIIAKYGLKDGESSVKGLVDYIRELLGDEYAFDPALSDNAAEGELSEVDKHVLDYFQAMLLVRIAGISESSIIPALNFVPTRMKEGKTVSNTANITNVTKAIDDLIKKELTGTSGVLGKVEDGNYNLDDLFTEDQMESLIKACVKKIEDSASSSDTKVEYATPDTLETDLLNYIKAKYYQEALNTVYPEPEATSLLVVKVSSMTDSSLTLLVNNFVAAYAADDKSTAAIYTALMNDAAVLASVDAIAAQLAENYGDVKAELLKAVSVMAAEAIAPSKAPSLSLDLPTKADDENPVTKADAMAAIDEIITAALPDATDATVADIITAVTDALSVYTFKEDADAAAEISEYVYFQYLTARKAVVYDNFYYDAELAKADAAVRANVAVLCEKLAAELPEDADVYDVMDVALAALANAQYEVDGVENNANGFVAAIAGEISHHVSGKNNLTTDVLNFFCYHLVNGFEGYEMSEEAPGFTTIESKKLKNALKQVDKHFNATISELITEIKVNAGRGEIPDYALLSHRSEEQLTAIYEDEVLELIDAYFATEDVADTLAAELEEYFKYMYYTAVLEELGAAKMPGFHVSEIYGDDLYTAGQQLKSLLRWYVAEYAGAMTEADIDALIGIQSSASEEEEEEASKYLSDDGRIVAVTYGSALAAGGYEAYTTFVLNYNNFSVSVVYNGVQYTIPAYDYVEIPYQKGK